MHSVLYPSPYPLPNSPPTEDIENKTHKQTRTIMHQHCVIASLSILFLSFYWLILSLTPIASVFLFLSPSPVALDSSVCFDFVLLTSLRRFRILRLFHSKSRLLSLFLDFVSFASLFSDCVLSSFSHCLSLRPSAHLAYLPMSAFFSFCFPLSSSSLHPIYEGECIEERGDASDAR